MTTSERFSRSLALWALPAVAVCVVLAAWVSYGVSAAESSDKMDDVGMRSDEVAAQRSAVLAAAGANALRAYEDENISADEYEAAVVETTQCLEAGLTELAGRDYAIEVHDPKMSGDSFEVSYSYTVRPTRPDSQGPSADAVQAAHDIEVGCQDTYSRSIEDLYQIDLLADDDYVANVNRDFILCLEAADLSVDADTGREAFTDFAASDSDDDLRAAARCLGHFPSIDNASPRATD